jgi:hypothetical protein
MRWAKVDTNHSDVVAALRGAGWHVRSTATIGLGFPDLIAAKDRFNVLVEVKNGSLAKLTRDQVVFHSEWPGPLVVATGPEDAVAQLQCLYSKMLPAG